MGSGSGLPSVMIAVANRDMPVYAVESKGRKTAFLLRLSVFLQLDEAVPEDWSKLRRAAVALFNLLRRGRPGALARYTTLNKVPGTF